MEPVTDEQLDYEDEEYAGVQKKQYHQGGAIPALAEEEMIGEEDDYDDLYNDVNVGEGFLQMQHSEAQVHSGVENSGFQSSKTNVPGSRPEEIGSQEVNNTRVSNEGSYARAGVQFPEHKSNLTASGAPAQTMDASQRGRLPEMAHNSQSSHLEYQGSPSMPHKAAAERMNNSGNIVSEPASMVYSNMGSSKGVLQVPSNLMNSNVNVNLNRSTEDEYLIRPSVENGNTMLFVGELHWWTTDAELESVLIQYGKVKEIKFFEERASGKSKGYCQVEFYDPPAAAACKEGMNGHIFNGRACVVAFATPQTIRQMGASYMNKNQTQTQSQLQGRNPANDGAGRGNGANYPSGGDAGRNFGRGGWGRGNQAPNRGPGAGPMRGRGGMGNKNMIGNAPNVGGGGVGGTYGQGLTGPGFGGPPGLLPPRGMMGPGFDLAFMGRGADYGGFSGPGFHGMVPFPAVNSMGLPGVAPHVNPAFFSRGLTPNGMNGMGMMGNTGMVGPHPGMWNDANMGGWGGEEQGRESSYGGDDNASEYGYGEASHDKGVRSSTASREKERNPERDRSSTQEKRHREEREHNGERYDRDPRHREEKDRYRDYRHKDGDSGYDNDRDRGQSSRSRSRSGAVPEDNHRSRSRDADYGKRRRMPSE